MEYSCYPLEQLMESYPAYEMLCDAFLNLARDKDTLEKLKGILYQGGWEGYGVSSHLDRKDNPHIEIQRRLGIARLLVSEPETFQFFVDHKVNLFHGTNANALPGIFQYGLNSVNALKELGLAVETGESWSRIRGERAFISLSDVYDTSEGYSMMTPQEKKGFLSFEVMVCTSEEEVRKHRIVRVSSDLSEVGVYGTLPVESICCICVPRRYLRFVRKLAGDSNIPILPMPNPKEKFYMIGEIFSEKKYEEFAHQREKEASLRFTKKELYQLANSRPIQAIKETLAKMGTIFMGEEEQQLGKRI